MSSSPADRSARFGAPDSDPEITEPCHCNQPDDQRDHSHQRGDEGFCRDTAEGPVRPAPYAEFSDGSIAVGFCSNPGCNVLGCPGDCA